MGISVWLIVSKQDLLQQVIDGMATKDNSPKFKPHITITSFRREDSIPLLAPVLQPIANRMLPIPLNLDGVAFGPAYFMSIYAEIKLEDNKQLIELYDRIHSALADEDILIPHRLFVPHLSLHYGTNTLEEKQAIVQELPEVALLEETKELLGNEVWVVQTEGPVDTWKILEKIKPAIID